MRPIIILLVLLLLVPLSSAAFITGQVNDALDGESADGHTIVLWKTSVGIHDNATDIIGPSGNSGASGFYMIDCFNSLISPCLVGDEVRVRVINNGDGYITSEASVIVTGAGFESMSSLTLNSPPSANALSPISYSNFSSSSVELMCQATDLDSNLASASLLGSWGGWHVNETKSISGSTNSTSFTKLLSEGIHQWSCMAMDSLGVSSAPQLNSTFTIDLTPPVINSVSVNVTAVCSMPQYVMVSCNASDFLTGVKNVSIMAVSPSTNSSFDASFSSGTYNAEVPINEEGAWGFVCMAEDYAGNVNSSASVQLIAGNGNEVDLVVTEENISTTNLNPIEGEEVIISALVNNYGCSPTSNFLVGFFANEEQIGNVSVSVAASSSMAINITWPAQIGLTSLKISADFTNLVIEVNEDNNNVSEFFEVTAWQEFYGEAFLETILADNSNINLGQWYNESATWNVFVVDQEAAIDWFSLMPLGFAVNGSASSQDFAELDSILQMSSFSDSVENTFSLSGVPKSSATFLINGIEIENVPTINSTNNSNFITGVLWDTSTDTNGRFDSIDKEEIVFITQVNNDKEGAYGIYDYEIKIPVRLREYHNLDDSEVYIYFDLT